MLVGRLLVLAAEVDEDLWWWRRRSLGLLGRPDDLLEEGPFGALLHQGKGLHARDGLLLHKGKSSCPARGVGDVYPHGGSASSSFCSRFSFTGVSDGGAYLFGGSGWRCHPCGSCTSSHGSGTPSST
jgi:hypothetical protein